MLFTQGHEAILNLSLAYFLYVYFEIFLIKIFFVFGVVGVVCWPGLTPVSPAVLALTTLLFPLQGYRLEPPGPSAHVFYAS